MSELMLVLAIALAANAYLGCFELARTLGWVSGSWRADGWPRLLLLAVACVGAAALPFPVTLAATALGLANGVLWTLWVWFAARRISR